MQLMMGVNRLWYLSVYTTFIKKCFLAAIMGTDVRLNGAFAFGIKEI